MCVFTMALALTPAMATTCGWHIKWLAVSDHYTVATNYYSFNGQRHPERTCMRQDEVLSYLHADHLGSTVLVT